MRGEWRLPISSCHERVWRSWPRIICRWLRICASVKKTPQRALRFFLFRFFRELESDRNRVENARHAIGGALRFHRAGFLVDPFGHGLNVPDEADGGHAADHVPGEVEFPPVEAVARRTLV